jgi:hypothetical protein
MRARFSDARRRERSETGVIYQAKAAATATWLRPVSCG